MDERNILRSLRHMIIDMDGVMYLGNKAIPGTNDFVRFLRERGISFVLATNNATRTPQQFAQKLAGMGIEIKAGEVLTSSQATAGYLAGLAPPGTRVFVVGMDGLRTALCDASFTLVDEDAEFVVAGMDFSVCYERLAQATLQIRAGARFIGTNPDLTFPSERGIVPGAGALLAFLEAASGVKPVVIGKPGTVMLEQAMARIGGQATDTGMLGDRLETDILAGRRAGLTTVLVLTGVTNRAMLARSEVQPDLVFEDLYQLAETWARVLDVTAQDRRARV